MNWGSLDNFFHMGGYGLYVWGAYGVTLALMVGEAWVLRKRHERAFDAARAEADAELATTGKAVL